jgi:soluble lytic murein transglycosylase
VTPDSAARTTMYAALATEVARARVANTEALARERTGDIPGAIRAFADLRMPVSALRLRAAIATDSAERGAVRRELVQILGGRSGAAIRTAVEVLDSSFAPLTPAEELAVARGLGLGSATRSQAAFSRAFAAGLGNARDRFEHGQILFRLGRHREAATAFGRVRKPDPLAGTAAYQRARSLLYAGDGTAAREALRGVLRDHPRDSGAATALYLLADLATDDLRDAPARDAFRELARRFPRHPLAPTAAFRGALIAYTSDNPRRAAVELDSVVTRYPSSSEAAAARYWAGRAWAAVDDTARARQRWRESTTRDPQSYYGAMAARRLGEVPWAPPAAADSFVHFPALDTAFARIDLLNRLGMEVEAGLEADALTTAAAESAERLLATAARFRDRGQTARSIGLAQLAIGKGAARDARVYRLIYPVVLRDVLVEESRATKLDPSLVAALIRQESRFVPEATSAAGARGLMQVMPDVGRILARAMAFPVWDPVLLYQADVNAKLGTRHLADLFREYDTLPEILAAYNAGSSRVERWNTKAGVDDPEMFTERIPYVETRDYVRIVQRNQELYRALYGWESALVP